jgi:polyisoprenoid-binding protein YceI
MKLAVLLTTLTLVSLSAGAAQKFDFKDPKGVNNVVFRLDAPLEAISGSASGIAGTVEFDPAHPGATTGKLVVSSSSLTVPNAMMKEHMHGGQWLDVAKHPEITFELKALKNAKTEGDVTTAEAFGTFTLKGVAKELTVPVKLTYLKGKLAARTNGQLKGDLLVLRSTFHINRSDFGIMAGQVADKVSESVELTLSLAGSSPE